MSLIKPVASLTSGLLARKGFARPAMRSPLQHHPDENDELVSPDSDDLGWNDLGDDIAPPILSLAVIPEVKDRRYAKPEVVLIQEAMARLMYVAPGTRRPRGTALVEGRRAAFTLRVDAERHSALRLACSVTHQSAQNFLIDALDKYLADMPGPAVFAAIREPRLLVASKATRLRKTETDT